MDMSWKNIVADFKQESRRQEDFTNSFWRQLLVVIVSIIIIQLVGPYVINMTAVHGTSTLASEVAR